MNCETAQIQVLHDPKEVPAEVAAHLDVCRECREFAALFGCIAGEQETVEPSPALDRRVLDSGRALVAARRPEVLPADEPGRLLKFPVLLFGGRLPAVAAVAAVLLAVTAVLLRPHTDPGAVATGAEAVAERLLSPSGDAAAPGPDAERIARADVPTAPEMPGDLDEPLFKLEVELYLEMERFSISSVSEGRF